MIKVKIQHLHDPCKESVSILLLRVPCEDEELSFNHCSSGQFTLTVKKVIHVVKHTGLSDIDPEVILKVI